MSLTGEGHSALQKAYPIKEDSPSSEESCSACVYVPKTLNIQLPCKALLEESSTADPYESKAKGLDYFLEDVMIIEAFNSIFSTERGGGRANVCLARSTETPLTREEMPRRSSEAGVEEDDYLALKAFLLCFLYAPCSEELPRVTLSEVEVEFLRLLLKHRLTLPRKKETRLNKINSNIFDRQHYLAICEDLRAELRPAENPILKRTLANQIQKLKRKRGANSSEPLTWTQVQDQLIQDSKTIFLRRFQKLMEALKDAVENKANHSLFNNFHLPLIRTQIMKAPELLGDHFLASNWGETN